MAGTVRQQHFVRYAGEHSEIGLRGVNLLARLPSIPT